MSAPLGTRPWRSTASITALHNNNATCLTQRREETRTHMLLNLNRSSQLKARNVVIFCPLKLENQVKNASLSVTLDLVLTSHKRKSFLKERHLGEGGV